MQALATGHRPSSSLEVTVMLQEVTAVPSVYSEKQAMVDSGMPFPDSITVSLRKNANPVQQWKSTRMTTVRETEQALESFQSQVDMADPVWY